MDVKKTLEKIGLTEGESKVYLALLQIGQSTAGPIVEKSGISNSKSYIILSKLEKKGLVSEILVDGVKEFIPTNPQRLIEILNEKKDEIDDLKKSVENSLPYFNVLQSMHEKKVLKCMLV